MADSTQPDATLPLLDAITRGGVFEIQSATEGFTLQTKGIFDVHLSQDELRKLSYELWCLANTDPSTANP